MIATMAIGAVAIITTIVTITIAATTIVIMAAMGDAAHGVTNARIVGAGVATASVAACGVTAADTRSQLAALRRHGVTAAEQNRYGAGSLFRIVAAFPKRVSASPIRSKPCLA